MSLSQVHIREGKMNFTYCSECNGDPNEDYDKPGSDTCPRVADRKEAKTTAVSKFLGQQQVWMGTGAQSRGAPHLLQSTSPCADRRLTKDWLPGPLAKCYRVVEGS